jgi:hypothetical protein
VNCYLELEGMHRFKEDHAWGMLLRRFRDGLATLDDIKWINERVVREGEIELPKNIRYATYFNRDRDSINTALFEKLCKELYEKNGNTDGCLIVLSDKVNIKNNSKKYVPLKNCIPFWESCGEDDVKLPQQEGRMDPVLRLYKSCPLMLPSNKNVAGGQAKGTQATLQKVVLKRGQQPRTVKLRGELPVMAVYASQVEHLVLAHCNGRIHPNTFLVEPKSHTYKARILKPRSLQVTGDDREWVSMKSIQLPVLINNATTGHKLQGSGVEELFGFWSAEEEHYTEHFTRINLL